MADALLRRLGFGDGMELWVAEADGEIVGLRPPGAGARHGVRRDLGAAPHDWNGVGAIYRALTAARARSALVLGKRLIHSDWTEESRPILERAGLVMSRRRRPTCGSPASRRVGRRACCVALASVRKCLLYRRELQPVVGSAALP